MKFCKGCGQQIPPKRVEILPNTQTCVNCSDTKKVQGVHFAAGKTEYGYQIFEADQAAQLHQKHRRTGFGSNIGLKSATNSSEMSQE